MLSPWVTQQFVATNNSQTRGKLIELEILLPSLTVDPVSDGNLRLSRINGLDVLEGWNTQIGLSLIAPDV